MTHPRTDMKRSAYRVLIVDDSALMRKLISDLISSAEELEVVGLARDSAEAVEMAGRLKPDVITLDVEMPGKSGLDALPDLLAVAPDSAVIMISSHTQAGAATTLAALERGAIDFFPKPDRNQLASMRESRSALVAKVMGAAQSKTSKRRSGEATGLSSRSSSGDLDFSTIKSTGFPAVVVGISTGGPHALGRVLPPLAASSPPILIVQHMPPTFTAVFAERLNRACSNLEVKEAEEGDRVMSGRVLVAPGGRHMTVAGTPTSPRIKLSDGPPVSGHRPSIDVLFKSASQLFGAATVGVIMTGMGRDGVEGCKEILAHGGLTFGQDEGSSVVYGMNKAAHLEGVVQKQFALEQFPALIKRFHVEKS